MIKSGFGYACYAWFSEFFYYKILIDDLKDPLQLLLFEKLFQHSL